MFAALGIITAAITAAALCSSLRLAREGHEAHEARPRELPPVFSHGGSFERHAVADVLARTEAFEPARWAWPRRRVDGRTEGRVGLRVFRVAVSRALLLQTRLGPKLLAEVSGGLAFYCALPLRFAHAARVPALLELYVCGRVIEGWRPRATIRAQRVVLDDPGLAPTTVAILGSPHTLPLVLQEALARGASDPLR